MRKFIFAFLAAIACGRNGGDTTSPGGNTPGFTLSAAPASVSFAQGSFTSLAINVARTNGFAGPVGLNVTGAPAGITASIDPSNATSGSATLTVAATSTTTPGSYPLTVVGSALGMANQSITVTVTISATSGSANNTTFAFCNADVPVWFAAQDGSGSWKRVIGDANGRFQFNISSSAGAVAYVSGTSASTRTQVYYLTQSEMVAQGQSQCSNANRTVTGTVANVAAGDGSAVALGFAIALPDASNPSFALTGILDGSVDLIASSYSPPPGGASAYYLVKKLIIRRDLSLANNSVLPLIDFNATEAFAPTTATLTIANGGTDQLLSTVAYFTRADGQGATIAVDATSSTPVRAIYGVPQGKQGPSDIHRILASASTASGTGTNLITASRSAAEYVKVIANKTLTLGAVPNPPTISTISSSPQVRTRAQWATQTDYNKRFTVSFSQSGGSARTVVLSASAGYFGGAPSTVDLATPDLSGVEGFDVGWSLKAATNTSWSITSTNNGARLFFTVVPSDGLSTLTSTRGGFFTP